MYLSILSAAVPLIAVILKLRKERLRHYTFIYFLLVLGAMQFMVVLHYIFTGENQTISYISSFLELIFLSYVLYDWNDGRKSKRTGLYIILTGFTAIIIVEALYQAEYLQVEFLYNSIKAFFLVLIAAHLLLFTARTSRDLFEDPRFWAASGVIIHYGAIVLLWLLMGEMRSLLKPDTIMIFWSLAFSGTNIICNALYAAAVMKLRPEIKLPGVAAAQRPS